MPIWCIRALTVKPIDKKHYACTMYSPTGTLIAKACFMTHIYCNQYFTNVKNVGNNYKTSRTLFMFWSGVWLQVKSIWYNISVWKVDYRVKKVMIYTKSGHFSLALGFVFIGYIVVTHTLSTYAIHFIYSYFEMHWYFGTKQCIILFQDNHISSWRIQ